MIVSKVRESREIQDRLFLSQLIVFVVKYLNLASLNEIHLLNTTLVADDSLCWLINPAVKVNDKLIDESSLTLFEKVVEAPLELLELGCLNDELCLHLGRHPLVKLEFLDNQIVVIEECLIDVVFDIVVKVWLDVERLVRLLDLLDPHV